MARNIRDKKTYEKYLVCENIFFMRNIMKSV